MFKSNLVTGRSCSSISHFFHQHFKPFSLEVLAGLPTTSPNGYLPLIEAKLKVDAEPEASQV
jgi:hypothetical protein